MRQLILSFLLLVCFNSYSFTKSFLLKNGIFIKNITIISSNHEGVIKSRTGHILIDNSKIIFIGKKKPKVKGNFKTINGKGKYAIPGLIDSHVHLNNIAGLNFRQRKSNEDLVKEYFERLPKNFLYYGYTTLIDVDNYASGTIKKLKKVPLRPDIHTCGQKVQVMNDFEMLMNEQPQTERYKTPFLHDKYNGHVKLPDSINKEEHSVTATVSKIAREGNICVKTLYEDSSSGIKQFWEVPSNQIMKDLVKEAHNENLPVILHAPSYQGQKLAVEAKIDIIAHAMWNWTSKSSEYLNTTLPDSHEELLLQIAKNKIGYQPTFRTILAERDVLKNTFQNEEILQKLYKPKYLEYLKSEDAQWSRNRILARPSFLKRINPEFYNPIRNQFNSDMEMFETLYDSYLIKMQKVVNFLAENNANLLFGTDNGAMNMYTNPPGLNGYFEMKHWIDAGISLEQILVAATYNNARAFNLLDSIGTIDKNKTANILVLNTSPLKTVEAFDDIKYIIVNGKLLKRESLTTNGNLK